MHVGYTGGFQNPGNRTSDALVYADELRLADLAVDLGFDSLWTVEHHFTDYFLSPDPVQYLTWMGARHPHVRLRRHLVTRHLDLPARLRLPTRHLNFASVLRPAPKHLLPQPRHQPVSHRGPFLSRRRHLRLRRNRHE